MAKDKNGLWKKSPREKMADGKNRKNNIKNNFSTTDVNIFVRMFFYAF